MYSKIIVPLDGSELSEQALPYAQMVAKSLSAPIELVQAYDLLPTTLLGTRGNREATAHLEQASQVRAEVSLAPARRRLEEAGLAVSSVTQRGSAADVISAQASSDPSSLVVMSTHGRGGISRWVMGSVTDKVLHTIPNPMLIVRANVMGPASPETSLQSVVVPLDGSPRSELSLPHAISMAATLSASITVLRVTPSEEHYRQELSAVTPELGAIPDLELLAPGDLIAEDKADVAAYLEDVSNRMAIDHAHGVVAEQVVRDNIAQTIIDRASAQPSLVVMSTHGRSGLGRMTLGSVTDRVIRHSNVPVLVIR